MIPEIGKEYRVACPFVRSVYTSYNEDGPSSILSWRPGVIFEAVGPWGDSSAPMAHGEGTAVYRVVDIHKLPTPYPARVFFIRTWVSPDGNAFGLRKLRITTLDAFRRRIAGYRSTACDDPYIVEDLDEAAKADLLGRSS